MLQPTISLLYNDPHGTIHFRYCGTSDPTQQDFLKLSVPMEYRKEGTLRNAHDKQRVPVIRMDYSILGWFLAISFHSLIVSLLSSCPYE
ncbi:hypothetical protein Q9233_006985 [Columba guinea]|nr:hypothetical protein Q9233_006985 [Columba guinea]